MTEKPEHTEILSTCCGKPRYIEEVYLSTKTGRKVIGEVICCIGGWKSSNPRIKSVHPCGAFKITRRAPRNFPMSAWTEMLRVHQLPPYYFQATKTGYEPECRQSWKDSPPEETTESAPQELAANDDTFGESFE